MEILCNLALAYEVAILGRVILSWFPLQSGGIFGKVNGLLGTITEPLLGPIRRVMPNAGPFDLSPIIALLLIEVVLRRLILRC
jgi:YggT family protein